jgi:hypothetical protein
VADPSKSASATVTVQQSTNIVVTINPTSATLGLNGGQTFTATVANTTNTAVTWSVQEGAAGGTVTNGAYVAPNVAGTYHVVVTSVADPSKSATATVEVQDVTPITITISPTAVTTTLNKSITFSATVGGTTNTAVTWSVQGAGVGSITSDGVYTTPATLASSPQVDQIVVTSVADPSKTATAPVTVEAGGGTIIIQ